MSNLAPATSAEACVSEPTSAPTLQVLPGRLTDIGGLAIRRLSITSDVAAASWCSFRREKRAELLLLGGAPFGETILMWWNFVGRTTEEIVEAREDWQSGRRFGDVQGYGGPRLEAPMFIARPVPRP